MIWFISMLMNRRSLRWLDVPEKHPKNSETWYSKEEAVGGQFENSCRLRCVWRKAVIQSTANRPTAHWARPREHRRDWSP
jgi:hypothetical protein